MFLDIALQNLTSPPVLFFVIGVAASLARSDLAVPDQIARLLSLYLMMSIGFRGGLEISHQGVHPTLAGALVAGVALSFLLPFLAERLLRLMTRLGPVDRAAVAGHYGSISAVTLAAVLMVTGQLAIPADGFMVAVAAAMETPAILACLLLAGQGGGAQSGRRLLREVFLNGSVVILIGALVVGAVAYPRAVATVKPFLVDLFPGFLCLFLFQLDHSIHCIHLTHLHAAGAFESYFKHTQPARRDVGVLAQPINRSITGGSRLFLALHGMSLSHVACFLCASLLLLL